MVSKNFPGVPAEKITIISVEVSVLKSYVSISCTGAGFPSPPPPFGDLRKISSPGNLDGSFSCRLSLGIYFCIFSFDYGARLYYHII
jgi:hypothetical protein